jgi:hypothetical protein
MTMTDVEADNGEVESEYEASRAPLPPIDFRILVLSLNTSALIQLGDAPREDGKQAVDLPMAQQTIDMLTVLEEKTRGNLSGDEERLLHQVLFDLKMRFVRCSNAGC